MLVMDFIVKVMMAVLRMQKSAFDNGLASVMT